jgi:hypothetical protein
MYWSTEVPPNLTQISIWFPVLGMEWDMLTEWNNVPEGKNVTVEQYRALM